MINRIIEQKTTKQVVIDIGLHKLLKVQATESGKTIKEFLEGYLADLLAVQPIKNKNVKIKDQTEEGGEKI